MALVHIVAKRWLGTARIYDVKAQEYVGGFSLDADIAINLPAGRYRVELSEVDGYVGESVSFTVADFFSTVRVEWLAEVVVLWEDRNKFINTTYTAGARFDIYVKEGQAFAALTEGNAVPMIDSALFVTQGLFAVISVIVNEAGTGIRILFTRAATQGMNYDPSFFKIKSTTNVDRALVYVDGNGTMEWEFSCEDVIMQGEVVTLDYTPESLNTINDEYGNELSPFTNLIVQNGSQEANPMFSSISIDVTGTRLIAVFNKVVHRGAAFTNTDLSLHVNPDITFGAMTYENGDNTNTLQFVIGGIVRKDAVCTLSYNGRTNGIIDAEFNSVATIVNRGVNNLSEEAYSDIVLWSGLDGTIDGSTYTATNTDFPVSHTAPITGPVLMATDIVKVGWSSLIRTSLAGNPMPSIKFDIPANGPFRVGVWHRRSNGVNYTQAILGIKNNVDAAQRIWLRVNNTSIQLVGTAGAVGWNILDNVVSGEFPYGTWFFYELTLDPTTRTINVYVNGVLVHTHVHGSAVPTAPYNIAVLEATNTIGMVDHNDNLIVSNTVSRELYPLALYDSYPG